MFGTGFWCSIRRTDLIQYHDYLLSAMKSQLKKIEIKTSQKDKNFLNKPLLKNSDQCYSGERETMGSSAANIIKLDQRSGDIQCRPDISNVSVNTYCDKVAYKGHSSFSMASSKLEIALLAVTIYNLRWRLITCKLGVFLSWF